MMINQIQADYRKVCNLDSRRGIDTGGHNGKKISMRNDRKFESTNDDAFRNRPIIGGLNAIAPHL